MPNRWKDWLDQAEGDLEQAEASRKDGRHEWACFAAHQAAEKAVKALPQGAPFEHYGPPRSEQAVTHARAILDFVHSQVA